MDAGPPPPPYTAGAAGESAVAAAITHAVYLTGGLVLLAIGMLEIAGSLGEILACVANNSACFGDQIYYEAGPTIAGGVVLLVIAVVLFVLASQALRRNQRRM